MLLADDLFRAQHVGRRRQYVSLVEGVRDAGVCSRTRFSHTISHQQLALAALSTSVSCCAHTLLSPSSAGAGVHIFSSLHVSGEQLSRLSGVAAILRFPLPIDIEEEGEEEGEPAA